MRDFYEIIGFDNAMVTLDKCFYLMTLSDHNIKMKVNTNYFDVEEAAYDDTYYISVNKVIRKISNKKD